MEFLKDNKLIASACNGDERDLNCLIEQVRPRLEEYVTRMTLDHHDAQDIIQESLIDMAKCLGKLQDSEKFWPWLRRIAFNKIRDYRRKEGRQKAIARNAWAGTKMEQAKGLSNLISKELADAVLKSMYELKDEHRQVLVLRCYEDMALRRSPRRWVAGSLAFGCCYAGRRGVAEEAGPQWVEQGRFIDGADRVWQADRDDRGGQPGSRDFGPDA